MVSGLNHLLERVKTSDLVQSGRGTSPDVVEGLTRVQQWYITIILRWSIPNTLISGL